MDKEDVRQWPPDMLERFFDKVVQVSETKCWIWIGATDDHGYGRMGILGTTIAAHRVGYILLRGPIPKGLDLDHTCRVHPCVNPWDVEPVTRRVNLLRGETIPARNAQLTHCPQNHPYDVNNTYFDPEGFRHCRTCGLSDDQKYYANHREERMTKQRNYYLTHREECLAQKRDYYLLHREEIRARAKAYRPKTKEENTHA